VDLLKSRPKETNNMLISSIGLESQMHSKIITLSQSLKNEVIIPLKEVFAGINKEFKQLIDSCKTMEKKLQGSNTNADLAFNLYAHSFAEHEKVYIKGLPPMEDLWLREYSYYNAVLSLPGKVK
jgi:hypothetical protein